MSIELAYSLHLGSDKNRKTSSKKIAESNSSGTTSFSNNGIQTVKQLSKVNNHNLRKYDNDTNEIFILCGTNNLYNDVQELYLQEFEQSRIEYNLKQTREDRKIENYFNHISNSKLWDLACEFIIELGDKDFLQDKNDEYKKKMIDVYREQIKDLLEVVPEFKIANAVIHFDESSPHLHIIGLPISDNNKRGMKKQVAKSKIFTKESLTKIQDKMRNCCIRSYNKFYGTVSELKKKQKGRNQDINVKDMGGYKEFKRQKNKKLADLENAYKKADLLNSKALEVNQALDKLKPSTFNKNNRIISNEDIEKIKDYIKNAKDVTKSFKKTSKVNNLINNVEQNYDNIRIENFALRDKVKNLENEVEVLKDKIDDKDNLIDKLQAEKEKFKEYYYKFKGFWQDVIKRFQGMIAYYKDTHYERVAKDLFNSGTFTKEEYEIVKDLYKPVKSAEELQIKGKNKNDRIK